MMAPQRYDAIVIGTGQGGKPLAAALARAGWSVAVIEREHVGGSCVNVGCTPTKTMVASARVAYLARRAAEYGVNTGPVTVDQEIVRQRKRSIVQSFSSGNRRGLEALESLDLIMGEASFVGAQGITVALQDGGARELASDKVFINTGARPAIPDIPGLHTVPYLDSTSIMELDAVPEHLLVLGGGYIGLEFGQMFRRFGSRVTIVERSEQLLRLEDTDVAEEIAKILREDEIEILFEAQVLRVGSGASRIQLTVGTAEGERVLDGSHLLVAAGRVPNIEPLNLAAAGVSVNEGGFIPVDDRLETDVPGIYALGDVIGGPAFTQTSYDDYRVLRANLLDGDSATITGRLVPYTIFIDPQLGRVGVSEQDARSKGLDFRVAKMPMAHVARALEMDESRGFMKAIVDGDTKQILGCAILGIEGGEIMSMVQIAMMGRLPYTALRDGIFAHPTFAEALNNLFAKLEA